MPDNRKYFIVKHDLRSLEALPNFIWRTEKDMPSAMRWVNNGARWIGFAYINNEEERTPVSLVTGFYECRVDVMHRGIPLKPGDPALAGETEAWMIEGEPYGRQPREPVSVPSIDELLGRRHFKGAMLVPIKSAEFDAIHEKVMDLENRKPSRV